VGFSTATLVSGILLNDLENPKAGPGVRSMNDIRDTTQFLTRYYTTFSSLDVDSIAPFFHEPCLFISPQGVVTSQTSENVKEVLKQIAEGLRPKGYGRSELTNLDVQRMSDATALARGVAVRYKADGHELERVGVTYVLQKSGDGWRIAVTVIHDV
jgi:ketosteroid isomerase-like protein